MKWSADWAPEPAAIKTATRLLTTIDGKLPKPGTATRGYWPNVLFAWPRQEIEVETFASHCELYQFRDGNLLAPDIPSFKPTRVGVGPLLKAFGQR
ncbi:hypothetical protein ACN2XU_00075 [Primorskyibacter sp. 2E107]|uniref:hypothetical protein n=1 Tax=Primorskyibacter sp. 2E107 TaxID=3403458 RepID=UPI003AF7D9C0